MSSRTCPTASSTSPSASRRTWAPFGRAPPASTRTVARPEASGERLTSSVRSTGAAVEEFSQLVNYQRVVAVRIGAGEGIRVDRELAGRKLVVGPSRYVALSLVIFLEQEPGRPKRRLTGDELDDRRQRRLPELGDRPSRPPMLRATALP